MKYVDYIKNLEMCPFCDYSKNRILIENKGAYLTYALAPYHKYHLLVIPKKHVESIKELTWDDNVSVTALVISALRALDVIGHNDCNILGRDGKALAKSIKHFHYNIIPGGQLEDISMDASVRELLSKSEQNILMKELEIITRA